MVRSSRTRSTSESCSKSAVKSSNDPASSIFADGTTLATACRKASRNSGWSSAMTRRVLTAAVIYFLQGTGFLTSIVLLWTLACKQTVLPCNKAVNPQRFVRRNRVNVEARSAFGICGDSNAGSQKSYWVRFHRDVTVKRTPWLNPAKSGAWGRALHQRISGSDPKCPPWLQRKLEPAA